MRKLSGSHYFSALAFSTFRFLIIIVFILFSFTGFSQGGNLIDLSGKVLDQETRQPIPGVSINIKGASTGVISNEKGEFKLRTKFSFPFTLVFSSVGFQPQEYVVRSISSNLNVALVTQTTLGQEVVVTASRVAESRLKSPVAIEKLDIRAIRETASPSFYDALETVKGVQMTTSSLTFKVPNTRGFNIPNNFRFMQLVDGVDMQAATLGVPLGNAIGPTELDIASVEITPGAASALYGMNAVNGLANLLTKNPSAYQGLSVYHKTGVNHVDGIDDAPSVLTETAIRYAKAYNEKFAFKINVGYMQGVDWRSNTRLDQNPNNLKSANPGFPALNGAANVAYDGWNKYGDDVLSGSNVVSIGGLNIDGKANQTLRVARTGYNEIDLVSPRVSNAKLDASLHYKFSPATELSYTYRIGQMDGTFQRGNKIRLDNVIVQNHHLEVKGKSFTISTYVSIENTGNSYNVKPLADNMDLYSGGATDTKTATSWGTKYKNALTDYGSTHGGLNEGNLAAATAFARDSADASRVKPGTKAFDDLKNQIVKINNWDIKSKAIPDAPVTGGAALKQRSRMFHAEGQWDLSDKTKIFDLLIGADARIYDIIPDGNNFVNFTRPIAERNQPEADGSFGRDVMYRKFGGFGQVTKKLLDDKLKLFGSLRWDYNPEFKPVYTPRLAAVYTLKEKHNFRFTYQLGYRFPALFEALSYVNNGRVKRVGSLPYINEGLGYLKNSYTQQSVVAFNAAVTAQGNTDDAALANKALLVPANLPDAGPEKIRSLEVGYKSVLADNRLVIDIDAYSNQYTGFLGQVQVYVPHGVTIGSDAAVLAMLDRNRDATAATGTTAASMGQDRYRVYTNAKNTYHNFGSSLGINWNWFRQYTIAGNINFNQMKSNTSGDIFVTGFNTPKWASHLSLGNRAVTPNIGFNVTWSWQDSFIWESPLVTGNVSAFSTLDAQISFHLPKIQSVVKVGGANVLNHRYIQYAGGPTLGALYYVAITVDGLMK